MISVIRNDFPYFLSKYYIGTPYLNRIRVHRVVQLISLVFRGKMHNPYRILYTHTFLLKNYRKVYCSSQKTMILAPEVQLCGTCRHMFKLSTCIPIYTKSRGRTYVTTTC